MWRQCESDVSSTRSCTRRLREHLLAHLICPGRHTISGLITTFGKQFRDWSADYLLYSKNRVNEDVIFHQIRREAKWRKPGKKQRPSTQDLINELRRELWARSIRPEVLTDFMNTARGHTKPLKSNPAYVARCLQPPHDARKNQTPGPGLQSRDSNRKSMRRKLAMLPPKQTNRSAPITRFCKVWSFGYIASSREIVPNSNPGWGYRLPRAMINCPAGT